MDAHDFTVTSVLACRCAFSLRNDLSSLIFERLGEIAKAESVCVCVYMCLKRGWEMRADKVKWIAPIGANKIGEIDKRYPIYIQFYPEALKHQNHQRNHFDPMAILFYSILSSLKWFQAMLFANSEIV